jgi:FkbM family methyltransferase
VGKRFCILAIGSAEDPRVPPDERPLVLDTGSIRRRYFRRGANVGQTVDRFREYFPSARIEAFEPVSNTFETLQENTDGLSNVYCHPFALGEAGETKTIELEPDSLLNSLTNEVSEPKGNTSTENISVRRLDEFCEEQDIRHIDVLKTDTEGYDIEVLEGGGKMLSEHRIDFVISETGFQLPAQRQTSFSALNEFLQGKEYRVAGFYEIEHERPSQPAIDYCNVLYARNGLLGPS